MQLAQQNNKYKSQLDKEKAENAHLQADIRTLTADWTAAREQLQERDVEARETMMEISRQGKAKESAKLLAVWRSVNSIKQDFQTTNKATAKDLEVLRSDIADWSGRLEQQAKAAYLEAQSLLDNERLAKEQLEIVLNERTNAFNEQKKKFDTEKADMVDDHP
eukprot:sb/3472668/